jgi:fermentation-respiration switch protein FrsA (DUF1100 family)
MEHDWADSPKITIHDVKLSTEWQGYQTVILVTDRGEISCRFVPVPGTRRGIIWVGDIDGDWDSPAHGLYPDLSHELAGNGIASLWVRYHDPTDLNAAVFAILTGIDYLVAQGIEIIALVGYAFGGAAVIRAAALHPVWTVVTLSTQRDSTDAVSRLAPGCSILLIHGTDDRVIAPSSSESVYRMAHEPKRLILFQGAGHSLDNVAREVHDAVRDWIISELSTRAG